MKKIALTLIVLFTVVLHISAQNDSIPHTEAQQKAAIKLATDWISMFYQVKDADPLMKITKTPFLLDGKEIVHSNEKLVEMYNTIIEDKSSQEFPEIKAEIFDNTKYVAKAEFAAMNSILIKIAITEKDKSTQHVLVFIEINGDDCKIIGFQD